MSTRIVWGLVTVAGIACATLAATVGADAAPGHAVEYRLRDWKASQFQDPNQANTLCDTLKRLNCEVVQEAQGAQIDVRYRCANWQRLTPANHNEVHRWEDWLRKRGFEVKHAH
jgi:hypothetical protein